MSKQRLKDALLSWKNGLGLLLVLLAYLYSCAQIHHVETTEYADDVEVIRMVHWQLESGVRETLQEEIERYQEMCAERGEKVRIIQIAVGEWGYPQFVRSNMIGGTLPDLVEWGRVGNPYDFMRYYSPITEPLLQPNPYNAGTVLQGEPWRETFTDQLRDSFVPEAQEYYYAGLCRYTIRLIYNKDLLQQTVGVSTAPERFEDFLDVCAQIEDYARANAVPLQPIASSEFTAQMFYWSLIVTMVSNFAFDLDYNYDVYLSLPERVEGFVLDEYSFTQTPDIRLAIEIYRRCTQYFTRGFMAVKRDESVRQFVQGKSVFYVTGSWDLKSLTTEHSDMELGVADFPLPGEDHPRYGPYFDGRVMEAGAKTAFSFAIARQSEHEDRAIDFLRYMTSLEVNERFNQKVAWIPAIRNAEVKGLLKGFEPDPEGTLAVEVFGGTPRLHQMTQQLLWPVVQGDMPLDEFLNTFQDRFLYPAAHDLKTTLNTDKRNLLLRRRQRALLRARSLIAHTEELRSKAVEKARDQDESLSWQTRMLVESQMRINDLLNLPDNPRAETLRQQLGLEKGESFVP